MLFQDFTPLLADAEAVAGYLESRGRDAATHAFDVARARGGERRERYGTPEWPDVLTEPVQLTVGTFRAFRTSRLLPVRWDMGDPTDPDASIDAEIEVAPFGLRTSLLTIRARYRPSDVPRATPAAGSADTVAVQVVQTALRDLLHAFAEDVTAAVEPIHICADGTERGGVPASGPDSASGHPFEGKERPSVRAL